MKTIYIWSVLFCMIGCMFASCEEQQLLVNSNDVSYLRFANNMTKDTTTVTFRMYNEGENAVVPVEVSIRGKIQTEDLPFAVKVDENRTNLSADLYELPADCKIRKGLLTDTIYVTLKNDPMLRTGTKILALQIVESEDVKLGDRLYSRALIKVTDRLFKPDWWSVNDAGSEDNPGNSVDWYYLGTYSEKKYEMFLDELKKDDVVFDGKNKQMLRKYALRLKNTLKDLNAGKEESDWVKDENGQIIRVVVAG